MTRPASTMRTRLSIASARSQPLGGGHARDLEDLGELAANAQGGVQRAAGILIDHRDAARAEAP